MKGKKKRLDKYLPTVGDIRNACEEIQDKWSDHERRKRAGLPRLEPWNPPMVPAALFTGDSEVAVD